MLRTSVDGLLSDDYDVPMNSQTVIDLFRELSALPLAVQLPISSFLREILVWIKTLQGAR